MPSPRLILTWALLGAGPALTGWGLWLTWILWRGGWAVGTEPQRIDALAWALFLVLGGVLAVVVAIAIGGPIRSVSGKAGMVEVKVEGDDE